MIARCADCGLAYEDFPIDVSLSDADWLRLVPDGAGVLCAMCIARRAATLPDVIVVEARLRTSAEYKQAEPCR